MKLTACALVAIGCLWIGTARAQDYNPSSGAPTAPANGSLIAPASPNGVDWLNSSLGLSPSFLSSDGTVNAAYVSVDLSAYAKKSDLSAYAATAGATFTGGVTFSAQSAVQAGLVFGSRTYAALPAGATTNVVWKCDDCTIGSGSAGVFVQWNGSAWVGLSGEAVVHP